MLQPTTLLKRRQVPLDIIYSLIQYSGHACRPEYGNRSTGQEHGPKLLNLPLVGGQRTAMIAGRVECGQNFEFIGSALACPKVLA